MDLILVLENLINLCIDFLNLWIWLAFRIWVWYLIELITLMNYHAETTMRLTHLFAQFLDYLLESEVDLNVNATLGAKENEM